MYGMSWGLWGIFIQDVIPTIYIRDKTNLTQKIVWANSQTATSRLYWIFKTIRSDNRIAITFLLDQWMQTRYCYCPWIHNDRYTWWNLKGFMIKFVWRKNDGKEFIGENKTVVIFRSLFDFLLSIDRKILDCQMLRISYFAYLWMAIFPNVHFSPSLILRFQNIFHISMMHSYGIKIFLYKFRIALRYIVGK